MLLESSDKESRLFSSFFDLRCDRLFDFLTMHANPWSFSSSNISRMSPMSSSTVGIGFEAGVVEGARVLGVIFPRSAAAFCVRRITRRRFKSSSLISLLRALRNSRDSSCGAMRARSLRWLKIFWDRWNRMMLSTNREGSSLSASRVARGHRLYLDTDPRRCTR